MEANKNQKTFKVKINEKFFYFEKKLVTGCEILEKSENMPVECYTLYQKFKKGDFEKIDLNEEVDLSQIGVERFVVKPPEIFHYFVDDEPESTEQKELTPNQILELAGINPVEDFYIVQIFEDRSQLSYQEKPNENITMVCPAMRFISVFRGETQVAGI